MTQFVIANNVNTQLATAASSAATTLTLASSVNLPTLSAGQIMPLTLNDAATGAIYEVVYVTAISGVTLTVMRAQEGTGAQNWNIGDYAFCAPTQGTTAVTTGNPNLTFMVAPATAGNMVPTMAQATGVVGTARNLSMAVAVASATATLTADEIIVETALGGLRYCLPSFNHTINLATTGAGGMDTGTAPASGAVAIYAIYNPTLGTSALLATNATSAAAPNVYGGANMPSGYTASALVSVWLTNASSQLTIGRQSDRKIWTSNIQALSTTSGSASLVSLSLSGAVPLNAKTIDGLVSLANTSSLGMLITLYPSTANAIGAKSIGQYVFAGNSNSQTFNDLPLITAQTLWYSTSSGGSPTFVMNTLAYTI